MRAAHAGWPALGKTPSQPSSMPGTVTAAHTIKYHVKSATRQMPPSPRVDDSPLILVIVLPLLLWTFFFLFFLLFFLFFVVIVSLLLGTLVFGVAERQNGRKDGAEQEQANAERVRFAELLGQFHRDLPGRDNVADGDQGQEEPQRFQLADFGDEEPLVVNGNKRFPSWPASFGEDLPANRDREEKNETTNHARHAHAGHSTKHSPVILCGGDHGGRRLRQTKHGK